MDLKSRINSLTRDMELTLKKWQSRGGQPTLSAMAESTKMWKSDLETLGNFREVQGPAYQSAQKSVAEAHHNRDNRAAVMEHSQKTLDALKTLPAEMASPQFVQSHQKVSMKGLYGEFATRHAQNPNIFSDIYQVRRQIAGLEASGTNVDRTNVLRTKVALKTLVAQYPEGSRIHDLGTRAMKCLDISQQLNPMDQRFARAFQEAGQYVDQIGTAVDRQDAPEGYKTALKGQSAAAVLAAVEALDTVFYSQPFMTPAQLMVKAIEELRHVEAVTKPYYDPTVDRLVASIKSAITETHTVGTHAKVKSYGLEAWGATQVQRPYETAMQHVSMLIKHLQTQI